MPLHTSLEPTVNPVLHDAIMEIVDNQLRDKRMPEVRLTLERLLASGRGRDEARRLIACVVSSVVYDVLKELRPFDETAYIAALQRLPTLPWEDDPG